MHWNELLAQATTTSSASTPAATPQGSPLGFLIPMVLIFVIFYFMLIRPQSQQRKKQAETQNALKSGDKIVTASGIVGVVVTVKDKTVSIRSADAKMEVTRSSVTEILESGASES